MISIHSYLFLFFYSNIKQCKVIINVKDQVLMQILDPRPVCKWLLCFHRSQLFENALQISQCTYHLHPSFSIPLCRLCDQIFPGISLINHILPCNLPYLLLSLSKFVLYNQTKLAGNCTQRGHSCLHLFSYTVKNFCYVCKINVKFPVISNSLLQK